MGGNTSVDLVIELQDSVGVGGDTHAVENGLSGLDDMALKFHRFTKDNSEPLVVKFDVTWYGGAAEADLQATSGRDSLHAGEIEIPAGENSVEITLSAVADGNIEGIERFNVLIIPNTDAGANPTNPYIPVDWKAEDVKDKIKGLDVFLHIYGYIVDGVTLVAAGNGDDTSGGNPGFALNDVYQGSVSNCFCAAAIAALVLEDWQHIQSQIVPVGGGDYDVTLYNGANNPVTYRVDSKLDRGRQMVQLSGDVDANGNAEIWPLLLEKAYARHIGGGSEEAGYEAMDNGGSSALVWQALTGKTASSASTTGMDSLAIFTMINNYLGNDKPLVIGTKKDTPAGEPVHGWHAYAVRSIQFNATAGEFGLELYNPWGGPSSKAFLPFSKFQYISSLAILEPLD